MRIWIFTPKSTEGIIQVSDVTGFLLQHNALVLGSWWVTARGGNVQVARTKEAVIGTETIRQPPCTGVRKNSSLGSI